jgi:superfamily II DNA or RNA helicase
MSNIYVLIEKIKKNMKIGSTKDFIKRMGNYITCSDEFDNNSHEIWNYKIVDSEYSCYQLDDIIQKLSRKYSIPYKKYDGTGGTEFYVKDKIENLSSFFDKIGIKYKLEKKDVDNIRNEVNKYSKREIIESEDEDELEREDIITITEEELKKLEEKLKLNNRFQLKDYQEKIRDTVKNYKERLEHIIISPTGTGKTVIFSVLICDYLKENKDVIILTKKKDILTQMPQRIPSYINKFMENNIVEKVDYELVNCLKDCSDKKINKKSKIPQIYIVNWDKFTSSQKTNYDKIDWNKFGIMIIDESHWVGANNIYEMMKYIKENTKLNYLGFSATPIRCNFENQEKTKEIFGSIQEDKYNIIYEYSFYEALTNKNICPVKYCPIYINTDDIEEVKEEKEEEYIDDNKKSCKVLSSKAYKKVFDQIRKEIIERKTSYFRKGIFWFRTRRDMLKFYNNMKDKIKDYELIPTMSYTKKDMENKDLFKLIKDSN